MAMSTRPLSRRALLATTALAAAALATLAAPAAAQAPAYPNKPIRLVVPYPPGGGTDILARLVATKLQEAWSQTVTVDNKPGASGVLGNDAVAKAPPDGYTLLLGITAIVQGATLFPKLPYDPYKDFAPVSLLSSSTSLLAVPNSLPVKTMAEFVALVKSQPGKHSFGTYGNGTSAHIQGELLKSQAGLDLIHVPYKGAAPLVTDLLGGQVSAAFVDVGTARAHVKAGAFKVLGATGTERLKMAPEVPLMSELGYKHFEPKGWFGFFLPAGTPAPIVKKLSTEIARIVRLPDVSQRIEELGQVPVGSSAEQFAEVIRYDGPLYAKLIKDLNIRLD
ncbi:Bug family tripartite tricarboxylate transporter substrate binding protein [Aquabacterium sp.]|uniref:Bug family tripartite tricarboxylate transporter substrate binding protein n=1 Tax=Aquabacterium sp. TaxID=1872578 RepID=UPI002CF67711|nr:tripartite tricarboxylate transporter substrate binding protein [Aquabacterium sp.]HSW08946.1 tripartite tricarboxylate transporter substrate binding protein [Aquabacterium sp.]